MSMDGCAAAATKPARRRGGWRGIRASGAGACIMTAAGVVHALRGRWFARDRYGIARCPVHDDRNPSLSVADGKTRLLVKCHAGCDPRDILDALRHRGILDELKPRGPTRPAPQPINNDPDRTAYALKIWHEAIDARGSPAWTYLFRRGVRSRRIAARHLACVALASPLSVGERPAWLHACAVHRRDHWRAEGNSSNGNHRRRERLIARRSARSRAA